MSVSSRGRSADTRTATPRPWTPASLMKAVAADFFVAWTTTRFVGGREGELRGGSPAHPGSGEVPARGVAEAARAGARLGLVDQPGDRLRRRQPQVAFHRPQHLSRRFVGA